MDITSINDFINNMGFPIAMVVYFIWDKNKNSKALMEIIGQLKDTLNRNTTILEKILTRFAMDGEE